MSQTRLKVDEAYEEDESYYFTDVVFLVENRLFKVPRHYFEAGSEVFRAMFQLPAPANVVPDGRSEKQPLRLDGIEKKDFKQLLKVLYPRTFGQEESLTVPEWTSVLKLATMWEFTEIRGLAIQKMSQLAIENFDKIIIAKDYHVTDWLIRGLNVLAQREEPMGAEDVRRLGWDYIFKLAEVRESFSSGCQHCNSTLRHTFASPPIPGAGTRVVHDFTKVIKRVFLEELGGELKDEADGRDVAPEPKPTFKFF